MTLGAVPSKRNRANGGGLLMLRGSVVRRSVNSWAVKLYLGLDPQSRKERQKWVGGFKTEAEAKAYLITVATSPAYGSGIGAFGSIRQRFGDFMTDWLEKAPCSEKERATRRSRYHRHVAPYLAHVPLAKVAPATIETLITERLTGLSGTTRRKVYKDIRMALDRAVRLGYILSNPADNVEPPREDEYRSAAADWTREGFARFIAACERVGDPGILIVATYICSARQGEMLGLTWPAVDFERCVLTFDKDLERPRGGGFRFHSVKTAKSRRRVKIPRAFAEELRALRKRQISERLRRGLCAVGADCRESRCGFWHDCEIVFASSNGKPMQGHNVTRRLLKRLCREVNVPPIRFHDIRHLSLTVLMEENVNPKIVSARAGHSKAAFTLDRYSWLRDVDQQDVAVEALVRSLPGRRTVPTEDATGMLPKTEGPDEHTAQAPIAGARALSAL